ncbi:MAG: N-acetylmuramoyl-L-alanine amidase, partial [Clostridia bacterium]
MKQHIAKLLVFLMLMTTMIVPADLSFAESGNENTTQTEESNAPQEKPDSTQETSAKSTNDEKIVEHESSPNSSVAKESIIAAENDQLEETVTERMEFLYIESKELVAPGTQNIVVSWTEAIDDIQNMVLEYENEQGKTLTLKESKRNDESIVFTKDFTASEAGIYKIKGVKYFIGNEEKYFAFDDVEIAASFKVVKGQDIEDDAIAKVEVDSNGTVNKKEVNSEIKDAVASTDAAPKAQTKARRAKSSNIVVVLDPGHGGSDSGATRGSVYEKSINFKVAQYCKAELEQYCGVTVYMTRTGDTNPSLQERAQIAANYGANILVSIHQNSGSSSAYGAEVYYPNRNYKPAIGDSGKAVADSIQKELVSLGLSNRGTKIRNTANGSTYADGSYSDYYGIIRNSKNLGIPAIIVEHAFLSNASDYNNFLSSDSKLQKLGIADATGIAKAFGLSKSGLFYDGTGWKFLNDDKTYFQDGWKTINGKKYYFKDEYALIGWQILDGNKYYFMPDGYAITGWFSFGSIRYYANDKGIVQKGMQQISGKYYYLGEDGVMQTGWKTLNGDRYFFMPDGYAITGWFSFGSIRYYANDKGIVQKGMQQISGKYYYLGEDGVMQTGWKTLNGDRYFFMPDGYAITGWFSFGSIRYYANDKG